MENNLFNNFCYYKSYYKDGLEYFGVYYKSYYYELYGYYCYYGYYGYKDYYDDKVFILSVSSDYKYGCYFYV